MTDTNSSRLPGCVIFILLCDEKNDKLSMFFFESTALVTKEVLITNFSRWLSLLVAEEIFITVVGFFCFFLF